MYLFDCYTFARHISTATQLKISIIVSHFDHKHRCLVQKNVPILLILPSRWQYGNESLGIERTSCLCPCLTVSEALQLGLSDEVESCWAAEVGLRTDFSSLKSTLQLHFGNFEVGTFNV